MQHEINAALLFVNSDRGFSFDELVLRLQEVLQQKGYRGGIPLFLHFSRIICLGQILLAHECSFTVTISIRCNADSCLQNTRQHPLCFACESKK